MEESGLTYSEEIVALLVEAVGLTIMYENRALVDDGHLRETLLGVHDGVHASEDHHGAEEANHGVVRVHVGALLFVS